MIKNDIHYFQRFPVNAEQIWDSKVVDDLSIEGVESDKNINNETTGFLKIQTAQNQKKNQDSKQQFDMNSWKLELDAVTPLLKIIIPNDAKDWRVHFDQVLDHQKVSFSVDTLLL